MLLVHPIREVVRFLPVLLVLVIARTVQGGEAWNLLGVLVPIALGIFRYLTTRFRIAGGRIELQRGLVNRHVTSTPVDRVRTVDLTSSLVQRVLDLTTVRIGTGTSATSDDAGLDLDGLRMDRARELRSELLRLAPAPVPEVPEPERHAELEVARFSPSWLRFAPLTGSGLAIAAVAFGALAQLGNGLDLWRHVDLDGLSVTRLSLLLLIPVLALILLTAVSVLAVLSYLVTNFGLRLSRTPGGRGWHLSRGLFTTRETTLDVDRLAGVRISEPLLLRAAGGASLLAIVTGLNRKETGSSILVPPAPEATVRAVAAAVLGGTEPVEAPLVPHGPAAVRRRWVRALGPALVLAAGCVVAVVVGAPVWVLTGFVVLPIAAALAADRARSLGHVLVAGHLVARSGSLRRRRRMLEVEHVIGWNLRATGFQRRVGLTTLVATTAGGPQAVAILDVPEDEAVRVATQALPGLVSQFLA